MRLLLAVITALALAGCAVNQGLQVVRTATYDAQGKLTGYTVEETLFLPQVSRPVDPAQKADVTLFETGSNSERDHAYWPPPAAGSALRASNSR